MYHHITLNVEEEVLWLPQIKTLMFSINLYLKSKQVAFNSGWLLSVAACYCHSESSCLTSAGTKFQLTFNIHPFLCLFAGSSCDQWHYGTHICLSVKLSMRQNLSILWGNFIIWNKHSFELKNKLIQIWWQMVKKKTALSKTHFWSRASFRLWPTTRSVP